MVSRGRRGNERRGVKWEGVSEALVVKELERVETGKSRLYLPEDRRRWEGPGAETRTKTCSWRRAGTRVAEDKKKWLASGAAVISIPSYFTYNENCVWKQCHLQRQSGKKLWSCPVQLCGSRGTVSRRWWSQLSVCTALCARKGHSLWFMSTTPIINLFWIVPLIITSFSSHSCDPLYLPERFSSYCSSRSTHSLLHQIQLHL